MKLRNLCLLALTCGILAAPVLAETAAGDPDAWHAPKPEQPQYIFIQGATVWTSGPQGCFFGIMSVCSVWDPFSPEDRPVGRFRNENVTRDSRPRDFKAQLSSFERHFPFGMATAVPSATRLLLV